MSRQQRSKFATSLLRYFAWDKSTIICVASFFLTFMAFNVSWCAWTTFTPFSHFPLYISTILFSLLLTLPYVFLRRKWLETVLLILLDFLLVANLMYARTYFNVIPLTSYGNAGNLADFLPSVWASLRWSDLVFLFITLGAILMLCKTEDAFDKRTNIRGYLTLLTIPIIITLCNFPTVEHYKKQFRTIANNAHAYRSTPVMYSVFGTMFYDLLVSYEHLTPEEEAETMAFIKSLPGVEPLPKGVVAPRNLVIIFCESLESWVVGLNYNGQQVTPNLAAVLADSTTYYNPNVLSQAADGRSIDGQLLDMTGIYPLLQGTFATQYPDNYYPSIHQALKHNRNARAILMTGDKEYVWNQGLIARRMGIDTIVSGNDYKIEESFTGRSHVGDRALMRQSVEKLKRGDLWPHNTPAFLQLVTYSGHGPFRLPDSMKTLKISPDIPENLANYMQVAHYTDEALGILLDYLKSRPDWRDTMVVITGDHEGLASSRDEAVQSTEGGKFVSKEQYVPLIILNSPVAGRSDKIMGQVDIYSSLLYLLGIRDYHWPGFGQSVFSPAHPGAAISAQGTIEPGVSAEQEHRLRMARKTADRALRYNLLKPHHAESW